LFLGWLANLTSLWLIPVVLGIVTTVAVFYELLKAPTISGRADHGQNRGTTDVSGHR
jgi:hypothetical protein